MDNYSDDVYSAINVFISDLKKIKAVIEKLNSYVLGLNDNSVFISELSNEQKNQIKVSIYTMSLKISSLNFENTITEITQLINALLENCVRAHSNKVDKNLSTLSDFFNLYVLPYNKTICDYLKYTNNIDNIRVGELVSKGTTVINITNIILKKADVIIDIN